MQFLKKISLSRKNKKNLFIAWLSLFVIPAWVFAQSTSADPELLNQYYKSLAEGNDLAAKLKVVEEKILRYQAQNRENELITTLKNKIDIVNAYAPNAAFEDEMRTILARELATVPDIEKRLKTNIKLEYRVRKLAPGKTKYIFVGNNQWKEPKNFSIIVEGPNKKAILNTLRHEAQHPCIAYHAGYALSIGIEEGLATFCGEDKESIDKQYQELAKVYPRIFSASQLYAMKGYPQEDQIMLMYYTSTALADFLFHTLEANLGPEKHKNEYRNIMISFTREAETRGLDAAIKEYKTKFGFNNVSVGSFERSFRAFVEERIQESVMPHFVQ